MQLTRKPVVLVHNAPTGVQLHYGARATLQAFPIDRVGIACLSSPNHINVVISNLLDLALCRSDAIAYHKLIPLDKHSYERTLIEYHAEGHSDRHEDS